MKKALYIITRPLAWLMMAIFVIVFFIVSRRYMEVQSRRQRVKKKFKYFRPTVHDGFFGKQVSWELRDSPLTDQEIDNII